MCTFCVFHDKSNKCCSSLLFPINRFRGMALWEGPQTGVLYWESHNLVNFPSLVPPLRLCVCTYLTLSNSNWRFGLCVQILYLFCLRPPNPTMNMLPREIRIWSMVISTQNQLFTQYLFLNFESQCILHSKLYKCAGKMTFKIEFSIAPI